MNVLRSVFCAAALLGMLACTKKNDDDGKGTTSAPSATAVTPSAEPKAPAPPAIEARVRTEVDGRADGITGTPLAASGATASLQAPKGWVSTKGDLTVVAAPDKKAQLAVGSFTPADGPSPRLPAAAAALGLTACEWSPPEPLTVGKTKLGAMAADGVCKRGATTVRTAYVAPTAEKLLVVGGWDPDGESAEVFGAMRSIAKVPTGDSSGIAACCAALRQNARSAPPEQQGYLIMAANMCDSMKNTPQGRATLAQVRAGLRGANVPSACR